MSTHQLQREDPQQRQPRRGPHAAARARAVAAELPAAGGATWARTARQNFDVYLRTAVSVDPQGWAQFGHVKMPDYRWGIFLNPAEKDRKIHFGDHKGEDAWQDVPGEYRANLRRIIVTQGDTEPAAVEQQRHLGLTCPSQYDLRNLFQVNVEEGRHLWAMVYLLHKYFGRDGREEGEALLERRSGQQDNPRILQAFNEETPDWLSLLHVHLLHRPRRQVPALRAGREQLRPAGAHDQVHADRGSAPHVRRRVAASAASSSAPAQAMNELKTDDPAKLRAAGVIDLPTIQRYLNFHFSVTIDLFGADESSNAATFYSTGLKGRFEEGKRSDDHLLKGQTYKVLEVQQRPARREGGADAQRAERGAARRLHQGLDRRRRALEQGDREGRHPVPPEGAAQGLPPQHRRAGRRQGVARRPRTSSEAEWNAERRAVAAERRATAPSSPA